LPCPFQASSPKNRQDISRETSPYAACFLSATRVAPFLAGKTPVPLDAIPLDACPTAYAKTPVLCFERLSRPRVQQSFIPAPLRLLRDLRVWIFLLLKSPRTKTLEREDVKKERKSGYLVFVIPIQAPYFRADGNPFFPLVLCIASVKSTPLNKTRLCCICPESWCPTSSWHRPKKYHQKGTRT